MRISRMHKGDYGKIRAFFDIEVISGFIVKGFKIVEGDKGLFVGNPSTKQKDGYQDTVFLAKQQKKEVETMAINEFNGNVKSEDSKDLDEVDFDKL